MDGETKRAVEAALQEERHRLLRSIAPLRKRAEAEAEAQASKVQRAIGLEWDESDSHATTTAFVEHLTAKAAAAALAGVEKIVTDAMID